MQKILRNFICKFFSSNLGRKFNFTNWKKILNNFLHHMQMHVCEKEIVINLKKKYNPFSLI